MPPSHCEIVSRVFTLPGENQAYLAFAFAAGNASRGYCPPLPSLGLAGSIVSFRRTWIVLWSYGTWRHNHQNRFLAGRGRGKKKVEWRKCQGREHKCLESRGLQCWKVRDSRAGRHTVGEKSMEQEGKKTILCISFGRLRHSYVSLPPQRPAYRGHVAKTDKA